MVVALLVFARRILRCHPLAVALGIKRRHVDLGLTFDHHLGKVITGTARGCDPKAEPFSQPHIAKTWSRANERVAVRRVTNRAVEIVLQTAILARRNAVDHSRVLFFDPLEIELEEVSAETVRYPMLKTSRRAFFVDTQNPASALLSNVGLCICIADHWVLGVGLTPLNQRGILIHHDELVFYWDCRSLDPEKFGRALGVVACRCHDVFSMYDDLFVAWHEVTALLDHFGACQIPMVTGPLISVHLPLAFDHHTALACAFRHRHGHVGRVNIAIRRMIKRTLQILSPDQRPALGYLLGRQPLVGDVAGFCG